MIDTGNHSCCSALANISGTKGHRFYFCPAILIARAAFLVPLSRSRFVPICAFHRPLSRADSAPSVRRSREGLSYRWRCQLPQQMPFYPDFRRELRTVGLLLCVDVYIRVPSNMEAIFVRRTARANEYPRNLRYSFRSFS